MANKTSKTKLKRLPQGQRKHVRRLKAAARKSGTVPVAPTGTVVQRGTVAPVKI